MTQLAPTADPETEAPANTTTAAAQAGRIARPEGLAGAGQPAADPGGAFHLQLADWAREYGRVSAATGQPAVLVLADHEAVAAVLRDRPEGFRRTDRLEAVGQEMGLKAGLFGVNGDVWKRQRRMVMAAFDPGHVKAYYPSLVTCGAAAGWPLDTSGASRPAHRPAGRPDALHCRCDRRPGLRHRREHAAVRRRHHPAPPGQDLPQAVHAHHRAGAVLALLQAAVGPRARPQRGGGECRHRRLHRQARQQLAADPTRRSAPQNLLRP